MSAQPVSSGELRGLAVAESRAPLAPEPASLSSPTLARIDLAALRRNIAVIHSRIAPGTRVLAMIKANAYGHGMLEVAAEAAAAGIDFFGIARVEEGVELRRAGFDQRVLLLELAAGERAAAAIELGLEITVGSLSQARELNALAQNLGYRAPIQVEVDTGMGRTGIAYAEAASQIEAIAGLPHLALAGVFSHFASSDDPDQRYAREQLNRFNAILDRLERRGVRVPLRHFANSGAVMALPESHYDLVRVGIMLYGYVSGAGVSVPGLTPVMSLRSSVSFIKTVDADTPISYDRRYRAPQRTRIATVLVGYGDGFPRLQSGQVDVLIGGRRYSVVGTICMDMIMVDIGLDDDIRVGDGVTLIGEDGGESITAWDVARRTGSIPYEITCRVAERVPRVFVNASHAGGAVRALP